MSQPRTSPPVTLSVVTPMYNEREAVDHFVARLRPVLDKDGSCDFSLDLSHAGRFRVNVSRQRTGYKRHTGFRSSLTQIEIESIGGGAKKSAAATPKAEKPAAKEAAAPARTAHPPKDYDELTVAQIAEQASSWRRPSDWSRWHSTPRGSCSRASW